MSTLNNRVFSGNVFIFQAFDIGDDINLDSVAESKALHRRPSILRKYFKNYHTPLEVELPHPHTSSKNSSTRLHSFGVVSLTYKVPFKQTLEELKKDIGEVYNEFQEQSVIDAGVIFKKIRPYIKQPKFFHLRSCYVIIQVDQKPDKVDVAELKSQLGGTIASLLRFETETLAEYQKNEILEATAGYYRGDLIIIDTEAAFIYDDEYEEVLDLFEFANIQQLELHYFDRVLDQQLNTVYERETTKVRLRNCMPFLSLFSKDPIADLNKLKVDISVIVEQLASSIKLAGDAYYSELYALLVEKMDLSNWKESIENKLSIIRDIRMIYQHKVDAIREDFLSVLITILIFLEMIIGLLHYLK